MISYNDIVSQIQANIGPGLTYNFSVTQIDLAADIESVMANEVKMDNSIHVIPIEEPANPNGSSNLVISRVAPKIGILMGVKNMYDAIGGEEVQDSAKTLREYVASTLQGYTPSGATIPMAFMGSKLVRYQDGVAWYLDIYEAGYNIREVV